MTSRSSNGSGAQVNNSSSGGTRAARVTTSTHVTTVAPTTACPSATTNATSYAVFEGNLADYVDHVHPSCGTTLDTSPDFLVTLPNIAGLIIDTIGSDFDTVLSLYSGRCSDTELACNDDGAQGMSRASQLRLPASASSTVTVAVSGYGAATGRFVLHVSDGTYCENSTPVSTDDWTIASSTSKSSDRFSSLCSTRAPSPDDFFDLVPTTSGVYDFRIISANFDAVIALVIGNCHGQELACNDDGSDDGLDRNPALSYYLVANQHYTLVVDGYGGERGDYTLSVNQNHLDMGSCCAASTQRAGCSDPVMAKCVCANQPACCGSKWTEECVKAAQTLNCGTCTGL